MVYFNAVKLNTHKYYGIGSYAVRNPKEIYVEIYWDKLEQKFLAYTGNQQLERISFYDEKTSNEIKFKGPFSIQPVARGLIQLSRKKVTLP